MNIENFSYPAENVFRSKPKNLRLEDVNLFSVEFNKNFTSVKTKTYSSVAVFSNGFCLINGLYFKPKNIRHRLSVYIKTLILVLNIRKKRNLEHAVLLTDINSSNFFHWFADVLQKIEALKFQGINLNHLTFLVPHCINVDLVSTVAKLYNISFAFIKKNEFLYIKNLTVVPEISPTGNYRPQLMRSMREIFTKELAVSSNSKRIYISRQKSLNRKIINEAELMPILKKYDFIVVSMEDFRFEEQMKLIVGAKVLVGLHGAGLTHMLWLSPYSNVMEIRLKEDNINNCYFSLASDLQINYHYCLADSLDKDKPTQLANCYVSPDEFLKSLELTLKDF